MALKIRAKKGSPGKTEFECPGCNRWMEVTAEQLAGAAETKCPNDGCSFAATFDIAARVAAQKDQPAAEPEA